MKIETLTSKLLKERTGETLPVFIKRLTDSGADLYTVQANLAMATSDTDEPPVVYDRRMVVKWMDTYK